MLATEVILDEGMLYFDARCSRRFPTVEIRVADICLDVRDAVLVASLCRGLVEAAAGEWKAGEPAPTVPTAMLRLATWQGARWRITERLLDPLTSRPRPAPEVITALLDRVRPGLCRYGDEALTTERVERIVRDRLLSEQPNLAAVCGARSEVDGQSNMPPPSSPVQLA